MNNKIFAICSNGKFIIFFGRFLWKKGWFQWMGPHISLKHLLDSLRNYFSLLSSMGGIPTNVGRYNLNRPKCKYVFFHSKIWISGENFHVSKNFLCTHFDMCTRWFFFDSARFWLYNLFSAYIMILKWCKIFSVSMIFYKVIVWLQLKYFFSSFQNLFKIFSLFLYVASNGLLWIKFVNSNEIL